MNQLAILFRDARFVVIDKPAGLPVHPNTGSNASVEDWFPLLSRRKDGPWLAHRLDTDTSGCLAIALRKAPLIAAQAAFASGAVMKTYWAVVRGHPGGESGVVNAPLIRRQIGRQWHMAVAATGQQASTSWRVLGQDGAITWLELRPHTGRTHQIRVHCAHLGCPILGDDFYGGPYGGGTGPLHLVARAIHIPLDPPVAATAEPPAALWPALQRCGWTQPGRATGARLTALPAWRIVLPG